MQFLIKAYDGTDKDALARRMSVRPDHLKSIERVKETGSVICAGAILGSDGKPAGSFLIMEFDSRKLLDDYLANEPYVINKVWQDISIEACSTVIMNDEMVGR